MDNNWYKNTSVYCILPHAFMDTVGNGIGDLNGITANLDYLKALGVETILLHCIFPSLKKDIGFDVSDFKSVDYDLGGIEDFKDLLKEVHKNDMKLIIDLPVNQTSRFHYWFDFKDPKYKLKYDDFYHFKDKGHMFPEKWRSLSGKQGWYYDQLRDQFYFSSTVEGQPDLNYESEDLQNEILDIIDFWLKTGVDGIRIPLLFNLFKDFDRNNNPFKWNLDLKNKEAIQFQMKEKPSVEYINNINGFLKKINNVFKEFPGKVFVGDLPGSMVEKELFDHSGLDHIRVNEFYDKRFSARNIKNIISKINTYYKDQSVSIELSNIHKNRFYDPDQKEKTKLVIALQFLMKGVPYVLYGEEIPLQNEKNRFPVSADVLYDKKWYQRRKSVQSRMAGRNAMLWDYSKNGGFSTVPRGNTLITVSKNYNKKNALANSNNLTSFYYFYKNMFELRSDEEAINKGDISICFEELNRINVLAFKRSAGSEVMIVFANFNDSTVEFEFNKEHFSLLFSSSYNTDDHESNSQRIRLLSYQVNVYKKEM